MMKHQGRARIDDMAATRLGAAEPGARRPWRAPRVKAIDLSGSTKNAPPAVTDDGLTTS